MQIKKKSATTAVMIPGKRIDLTNSNDLKIKFMELCNEGFSNIIIDLTNVKAIDSSGIGKLHFHKKLKERHGQLTIINITSEYLKRMFNMIELNKLMKIED